MDVEELRKLALGFPGAEESMPFGPDHLVFKVGGKMFMLLPLEKFPVSVNVKQDPEKSLRLREEYHQISPGWHMNKKHWNTVVCQGLPAKLIEETVGDSYSLVLKSLPKTTRERLTKQHSQDSNS